MLYLFAIYWINISSQDIVSHWQSNQPIELSECLQKIQDQPPERPWANVLRIYACDPT